MVKVRLQIIYIFLLFQMSNSLLISAKVRLIFLLCIPPQKIKYFWPRRDSNTQPSDLESDALPLRHGVTVYWWWDFGLEKREGSTEIWTRIAGFKVQSANHYTIEPCLATVFKREYWIICIEDNINIILTLQCYMDWCHLVLKMLTKKNVSRRSCACEAHVINATLRKLITIVTDNY